MLVVRIRESVRAASAQTWNDPRSSDAGRIGRSRAALNSSPTPGSSTTGPQRTGTSPSSRSSAKDFQRRPSSSRPTSWSGSLLARAQSEQAAHHRPARHAAACRRTSRTTATTSGSSRTIFPTSSASAKATKCATCRIRCRRSACGSTISRCPTASRSERRAAHPRLRGEGSAERRSAAADRRRALSRSGEADVVRMNVSFTRAALLDKALEELSIVLENRLVAGRIGCRADRRSRSGESGSGSTIRFAGSFAADGRLVNTNSTSDCRRRSSAGPRSCRRRRRSTRVRWTGAILDSLPPDVRAVTDPDIQRVQAEARALVRAQALARAQRATLSARNVSDFARFNRVEGLALGGGVAKQIGSGVSSDRSCALRHRRSAREGEWHADRRSRADPGCDCSGRAISATLATSPSDRAS